MHAHRQTMAYTLTHRCKTRTHKNNDDYANNHCIEIYFRENRMNVSAVFRYHKFMRRCFFCWILVCLHFGIAIFFFFFQILAWNGNTKAMCAIIFGTCIKEARSTQIWLHMKFKMDWKAKKKCIQPNLMTK